MAFNDATCPKCGKKIRWVGDLVDRPSCPQCGHQISSEELQRADEEMRAFTEEFLEKKRKKTLE